MGGRMFSWLKDDGCDVQGDRVGLKLSNGLASGGDIRLDTGGRRFILMSLAGRIVKQIGLMICPTTLMGWI
jgi:hypothetical protein